MHVHRGDEVPGIRPGIRAYGLVTLRKPRREKVAMSSQDDEIERLKRLRERQLSDRDPRKRDKRFQYRVSQRPKKKLTVEDVLKDIPSKWWGMIIGGIIGIALAIVVNIALGEIASWIQYVGIIIVLSLVVLGRLLGAAVSWREEDHEKLVKRW
jgi:hypothetical protein